MSTPVPSIARWLVRLVAGPEHRDVLLDDLDEEAEALARSEGPAAARAGAGDRLRRRWHRWRPAAPKPHSRH